MNYLAFAIVPSWDEWLLPATYAYAYTYSSIHGSDHCPGPAHPFTGGEPTSADQVSAGISWHGTTPGGVRERPNRHAWKACEWQHSVGSNPTLSARGS